MATGVVRSDDDLSETDTPLTRGVLAEVYAAAEMPLEDCKALIAGFQVAMARGLAGQESDLKMLPSFVTELPTGKEAGTVYALDLGGTNFRVLRVVLPGDSGDIKTEFRSFALQKCHMTGCGEADLFPFLASCIKETVEQFEGSLPGADKPLPLGFTFSFPTQQSALNQGTLISWTKGFCASKCVGCDVVAMLQKALNALGVHVVVKALANDTVGTLMALRPKEPNTSLGVIFGTGTNGCYVEQMSKIGKWTGGDVTSGRQCINIEWGNFGASVPSRKLLPVTRHDEALDTESLNKGEQILEKMIGGMYIGELVRRVFNAAADAGEIMSGRKERIEAGGLNTELASAIEASDAPGLVKILEQLGVPAPAASDAKALQKIAMAISGRGARVSACAIAAIVQHMERVGTPTVVGIDGSVFKCYTNFKARIEACMRDIFGDDALHIKLQLSEDGSGVGAAVIAATA
jgi:hexokinase